MALARCSKPIRTDDQFDCASVRSGFCLGPPWPDWPTVLCVARALDPDGVRL